MVFELQPKYVKDGQSHLFKIKIEEDLKEEKYDELFEEFLDKVFEIESKITKDDWMKHIVDH